MSAADKKMLKAAAAAALQGASRGDDIRTFFLGAVGLRNDGVIVASRNVASRDVALSHHAEARLSRKLTPNSEVWVARVRKNGEWAMAKPCASCQLKLRVAGVTRVVYTIDINEWGVLDLGEI
jgi:tRNA(Arg) A34 adenosine deaminase TadA